MKKLLGLLLTTSLLWSAPSSTFNYLMDEPMSMLEWGMYKTEKLFKGCSAKGVDEKEIMKESYTNVNYNWDNDRLDININFYLENKLNKAKAKDICKKTLESYREEWLKYILPSQFNHTGFTRTSKPKNFDDEIMNRVYYTISIRTSKTNKAPFEAKAICEGFYNSDKVMYSE